MKDKTFLKYAIDLSVALIPGSLVYAGLRGERSYEKSESLAGKYAGLGDKPRAKKQITQVLTHRILIDFISSAGFYIPLGLTISLGGDWLAAPIFMIPTGMLRIGGYFIDNSFAEENERKIEEYKKRLAPKMDLEGNLTLEGRVEENE